jgi:hypothetical protein
MKKLRDWWYAERVNRPERGTSQDMCPTNGEAVINFVMLCVAWSPLALWFVIKYF